MEIEIKFKQNLGGSCGGKQESTVIQVPNAEGKVTITIDQNISCVCNGYKGNYSQYGGYGGGVGHLCQFYSGGTKHV